MRIGLINIVDNLGAFKIEIQEYIDTLIVVDGNSSILFPIIKS